METGNNKLRIDENQASKIVFESEKERERERQTHFHVGRIEPESISFALFHIEIEI
jgi:hypothetical protein